MICWTCDSIHKQGVNCEGLKNFGLKQINLKIHNFKTCLINWQRETQIKENIQENKRVKGRDITPENYTSSALR